MIFPFRRIIAYISTFTTLVPGAGARFDRRSG